MARQGVSPLSVTPQGRRASDDSNTPAHHLLLLRVLVLEHVILGGHDDNGDAAVVHCILVVVPAIQLALGPLQYEREILIRSMLREIEALVQQTGVCVWRSGKRGISSTKAYRGSPDWGLPGMSSRETNQLQRG